MKMKNIDWTYSKYEIVTKKTKNIEKNELTVGFLFDFYSLGCNRDVVLKVYEGGIYIGAWDFYVSINCNKNCVIDYYLDNVIFSNYIDFIQEDITVEDLDNIFKRFYMSKFILIKGEESESEADFITIKDIDDLKSKIRKGLKSYLDKRGIKNWRIIFPYDANKSNFGIDAVYRLFWADERRSCANKILKNITENDYQEVRNYFLKEKKDFRELDNRILPRVFLVGPCIVDGIRMPNEQFSCMLQNSVSDYEIVNVVEWESIEECYTKILEHDLYENDIVLFMDYTSIDVEADICVGDMFNKIQDKHWLYTDILIHTTKWGNEELIKIIQNVILNPIRMTMKNVVSSKQLHKREKQCITCNVIWEIERYLHNVKEKTKVERFDGTVGAIVMNANPFTKGHRYLVEYASKNVDFLYVFVVEEDASYVPFNARIQMVEMGTSDLKNVCVLGSGKFIISKQTMAGYFMKERITAEKFDPAQDVNIFSTIIAKELGICKRFLGEEPLDPITYKYNKKMHEVFPKHGIEVIEIPRIKIENDIVSATKVRKLFLENKWESIHKIVPETTFQYMYQNQANLESLRENKNDIWKKQVWDEIEKWFNMQYKPVVYGIGQNTELLWSKISDDIKDKIQFVDKKASERILFFKNKRVLSPEELKKDDNIFISSTKYSLEIYEELCEREIKKEQIYIMPIMIIE